MERVWHLGDSDFALPLSAALVAGLAAAGAQAQAVRFGLLFAGVLILVVATKVAWLGWGTGVALLDYKALSGHAAVVSALYPFMAWVVLRPFGTTYAWVAMALCLLLAVGVAFVLVAADEHSSAEVAGGWLAGASASIASTLHARRMHTRRGLMAIAIALLVWALCAWAMQYAHIGYWLIKLALLLSGNAIPHAWIPQQ